MACNVVAAIHGPDAVAVDDNHLRVACHVGHAAAAEHRAVDHQIRSRTRGETVGRGVALP